MIVSKNEEWRLVNEVMNKLTEIGFGFEARVAPAPIPRSALLVSGFQLRGLSLPTFSPHL